ncbi:hypothetical protein FB45DRAFT_918507 [Roridomyces roridus]|uniref:Uncharacterized protein n=1 Tax=Roridomyces roridus TaxID=1738132 RepID=A0AAD7FMB1_9AGAR|nr:hypothetical protein FB45DRAFT_918507 [Roridomyces roridus]
MASSTLTVAGFTLTTSQVHWLVITAATIVGMFLIIYACFTIVSALYQRRHGSGKKKKGRILSALKTLPESPFLPRPPAALPSPMRSYSQADVYRYPGNCWNGEHLLPRPRPPPPPIVKPKPLPMAPTLWETVQRLQAVADDVVGAHPDALPLQDRYDANVKNIEGPFPWVTSAGVGKDFKFGLVHTIDTTPAPASPVKVKKTVDCQQKPELYKWGNVTHTLDLPLRGNKAQRPPLVRSTKHNVITNVVFDRSSPFYTSTNDKENIQYSSPRAVRALV